MCRVDGSAVHLLYLYYQKPRLIVPGQVLVRDAPLDIWGPGGGGGGVGVGLEFLLLANFFFTSERKQSFFGDQRPTIFFLCFVEGFFVVCFPYYVGYHSVFFL